MKKATLILFTLLLTTTLLGQAQDKREDSEEKEPEVNAHGPIDINWYNKGVFFDLNGGIRVLKETANSSNLKIRPTFNAGIGYLFNEKFGIKGRLDYHNYATDSGPMDALAHSVSLSAEGVMNLMQVIGGQDISRDLALTLHVGVGLTTMFKPEYIRYFKDELGREFNDPAIKGADDIFHVIVGISPEYHINSRISINLDISQFFQFKQYKSFDRNNAAVTNKPVGVFGATLGVTYRLD